MEPHQVKAEEKDHRAREDGNYLPLNGLTVDEPADDGGNQKKQHEDGADVAKRGFPPEGRSEIQTEGFAHLGGAELAWDSHEELPLFRMKGLQHAVLRGKRFDRDCGMLVVRWVSSGI